MIVGAFFVCVFVGLFKNLFCNQPYFNKLIVELYAVSLLAVMLGRSPCMCCGAACLLMFENSAEQEFTQMVVRSNQRFANARILVVDDVDFTRRLISSALVKSGFSCIETAENGAEALQKTYDVCPDLVILDLNMPKLDGFGYCELVRGDKNLPRMPIVVQTGFDERKARLRALSCGADDFLTKPLDMDELSLRICVHVDRYFMLRDMSNMCDYLEMEVEKTQELRRYIEQSSEPQSGHDLLDKHLDVMKELIEFSS